MTLGEARLLVPRSDDFGEPNLSRLIWDPKLKSQTQPSRMGREQLNIKQYRKRREYPNKKKYVANRNNKY